ncbi:serine/threonine-protein kinase ATM isoform X1 [Trifolium pratense]|uniref:serine/threonine-protein kinase ATM isoform X1 n=1 Tax=Trifolium pratense TaxID=57577 RepID=UPI001E696C86|nr:serine/threonine-protein kinase ATM isoform X1 [Trifolium pratense]
MDVFQAYARPENVDFGFEVKMTENTPVTQSVPQAEAGTGNVDSFNMPMTNTSEKIGGEAGPETVDSANEAKMTFNTPMTNTLEKIGSKAGTEIVDSGNVQQMTGNTQMTNTLEKTGGGVDSRLRRRSKYLSYPYTDGGPGHKDLPAETEESKTPRPPVKAKASRRTRNASNGSISSAKSGGKRFRSNWDRKFISCSIMSSSPEFINASSGDLLSGLYSMAVDCMSPIENKNFDMVEWFFCKRRISEYRDEAELAISLVNENGGKTEKPVANDLVDTKSEKKRKNSKTENAARCKIKPLSGLSDMKASTSTGNCTSSGKKLKQKRKVEEITSMHQLQNAETTINDSGNKCSSVPETPQNHNFLASAKMTGPKKKQKLEAAQVHQGVQSASRVDAKSIGCSSIVIDLQLTPPIPVDIHGKSNGQSKGGLVSKVSNPEIRVYQNKLDGNVTHSNLLVSTAPEAGTASQEGRVGNITNHLLVNTAPHEHPNAEHARAIPDLNNISFESGSRRKESETVNFLSPELKSDHPRSLSACSNRTKTVNFDRVQDNGVSSGTFLFLQFAPGPGVDIPSKDDLLKTFCRFGPLKASETQSIKDNGSAQIVFVRNTDAAEALRNLEQNNPFGATLVGCRLHHPPAVAAPSERFRTPTQPTRPMRIPLQLVKLNLEMMQADLEKSGHTISPQKRAELESGVKNLRQLYEKYSGLN